MRYWLMISFFALFVVANVSDPQEPKKKDKEKDKGPQPFAEISEWAGKTFPEWKKDLHNTDMSEREVAFRAIVMFPLDKVYTALPDILAELKKHSKDNPVDLSVRVNGVIAIGKILQAKQMPSHELINYLDEKKKTLDPKIVEALTAKQKKDPKTGEPIPSKELLDYWKKNGPDPKHVEDLIAKQKADPKHVAEALSIIRTCLTDSQVILKVRAVQVLPYLGPDSRKNLKEVLQMTNDPSSWEVRQEALYTLATMGFTEKGPDESVLPAFTKGLNNPSARVRIAAARGFGKLGGAMKEADKKAPILKQLADALKKEKNHHVIVAIHVAVISVYQQLSQEHLGPIRKFIEDDPSPMVRLDAIAAIAQAGPDCKKHCKGVVETLLGTVKHPVNDVGVNALLAVVHLQAVEALPQLKELFKDLKDDKSANVVIRDNVEDAITQLEAIVKHRKDEQEKKDGKKGDKK